MSLLELQSVSKVFRGGIRAVEDVALDIDQGSFVSILGPSGCGKTTLLRLIAGLTTPTSGEIVMDSRRIEGPGPERGLVFQEYTSFPWLSVRDNIAFGLRLTADSAESEIMRRVDELLSAVDLMEFADAYPGRLSGGQQQRVALARSLAVSPKVLLLDEPFGALDAQTRNDMQILLLGLWIELGQTTLFVTHDIEEAVFLGQQIVVSTPRPFRIASKVSSALTAHRTQELKLTKTFMEAEQQITLLLRKARADSSQ